MCVHEIPAVFDFFDKSQATHAKTSLLKISTHCNKKNNREKKIRKLGFFRVSVQTKSTPTLRERPLAQVRCITESSGSQHSHVVITEKTPASTTLRGSLEMMCGCQCRPCCVSRRDRTCARARCCLRTALPQPASVPQRSAVVPDDG